MTGFVKAQRTRFDHPLFRGEKFCRGYAWDWLVANAAYKPRKVGVKGKTVTLQRGQLTASIRFLATAWNWDKAAVSRFLARLKTEAMIETGTETGQMVITICNYEEYQGEEPFCRYRTQDGERDGSETAARQTRRREEGKKGGGGSDKSNPPPPQAGGDLPDGFEAQLADALGIEEKAPLPSMWRSAKGRAHLAGLVAEHGAERVVAVARASRGKHPEVPKSPKALDHHLAEPPPAPPPDAETPNTAARFWAEKINAGRYVAPNAVSAGTARLMLAQELVTAEQLRRLGISA